MERTYTAFISYRHAPLDIFVAERLQKMLERFRMPAERRRKSVEKLGLVFRDRDELPLSSDLTQDIYKALDRSQFLIVICTPETPKSVWVAREIEYFISRHGYRRVLTVLAAGTPEESLPSQLTHIRDEDGTIREVEPLCAFVAAPNRRGVLRNLRSEFLRLVSAILECPYDVLYQRDKRYRLRKLSLGLGVVGLVALSFAGVMMRNYLEVQAINKEIQLRNEEIEARNEEIEILNQEISVQLRQTQMNESQALALVSAQQLAEGDRLGAIQSALAALPSDEGDRPFVAEAESALFGALYAYEDTGVRFAARMEQDNDIYTAALSDDGSFVVTMDKGGFIQCFDATSGNRLWSAQVSYTDYVTPTALNINLLCLAFLGDWGVLCANSRELIVFSAQDGSVLYTTEYPDGAVNAAILSPDDSLLGVYDSYSHCFSFYDLITDLITVQEIAQELGYYDYFSVYDLIKAERVGRTDIRQALEESSWHFRDAQFSQDGSLLYAAFAPYDPDEFYTVLTIDIASFQILNRYDCADALEPVRYSFSDLLLSPLPNGELLVYWDRELSDTGVNRRVHHLTRLSPQGEVLFMTRYEQDFGSTANGSFVASEDPNLHVTENKIWCAYESYVLGFDLIDGSQVFATELPSDALLAFPVPEDDRLALVLADGTIRCVSDTGIIVNTETDGFDDCKFDLLMAFGNSQDNGNLCVVPEQAPNCIVLFASLRDENTEILTPPLLSRREQEQNRELFTHDFYPFPSGDRILAYKWGYADIDSDKYEFVLTIYDAMSLEILDSFYFTSEELIYDLQGFSADETKIFLSDCAINLKDHSVTPLEGKDKLDRFSFTKLGCNPLSHNGEGTLFAHYEDNTLFWWQDGSPQSVPCPYDFDFSSNYQTPVIGGSGLVVLGLYERSSRSAKKILGYAIYSTRNDRWTWLDNPDTALGDPVRCVGETHPWLALAGLDGRLRIYDQDIDRIIHEFEMNLSSATVEEMIYVLDDQVLLLRLSSGRLLAVDTQTGDTLGHFYLGGTSSYTELALWLDTEYEMLYIWDANSIFMTGLCIDTSNWSVRFSVPHMASYVPASNRIIRYSDSRTELFHYPVYTTQELIQWGNQVLSSQ